MAGALDHEGPASVDLGEAATHRYAHADGRSLGAPEDVDLGQSSGGGSLPPDDVAPGPVDAPPAPESTAEPSFWFELLDNPGKQVRHGGSSPAQRRAGTVSQVSHPPCP